MERIEKDVLVQDNIRRDIAEIHKDSIRAETAAFPYLIMLVPCVVLLCALLPSMVAPKYAVLFSVILILAAIGVSLFSIIPYVKKKRQISEILRMPIVIKKAPLESLKEDSDYRMVGRRIYIQEDEYTFPEGRTFTAKSVPYYVWSDTYHTSRVGLRNTSVLGNEFYLVFEEGKFKIKMIYNTKFFKYSETNEF